MAEKRSFTSPFAAKNTSIEKVGDTINLKGTFVLGGQIGTPKENPERFVRERKQTTKAGREYSEYNFSLVVTPDDSTSTNGKPLQPIEGGKEPQTLKAALEKCGVEIKNDRVYVNVGVYSSVMGAYALCGLAGLDFKTRLKIVCTQISIKGGRVYVNAPNILAVEFDESIAKTIEAKKTPYGNVQGAQPAQAAAPVAKAAPAPAPAPAAYEVEDDDDLPF